jgi:hypothetical protein
VVCFRFIHLRSNGLAPARLLDECTRQLPFSPDVLEYVEAFEICPSGFHPVLGFYLHFETGTTAAVVSFHDRGGTHRNGTVFLMAQDNDERKQMEMRIRKFTDLELPQSPLALLIQFDADPTLIEQSGNVAAAFFALSPL